jgi:hypothetical protein
VEGSCEHGNEFSGPTKCWDSQEGLSSMELYGWFGFGFGFGNPVPTFLVIMVCYNAVVS